MRSLQWLEGDDDDVGFFCWLVFPLLPFLPLNWLIWIADGSRDIMWYIRLFGILLISRLDWWKIGRMGSKRAHFYILIFSIYPADDIHILVIESTQFDPQTARRRHTTLTNIPPIPHRNRYQARKGKEEDQSTRKRFDISLTVEWAALIAQSLKRKKYTIF